MEEENSPQSVILAKDIAELVIKRYPMLTLYDVKTAMMSAEQFLLDSKYHTRKGDNEDPFQK